LREGGGRLDLVEKISELVMSDNKKQQQQHHIGSFLGNNAYTGICVAHTHCFKNVEKRQRAAT